MRVKNTFALFHQGICSLFVKWLITRAASAALQEINVSCKIVLYVACRLFFDDLYLIKSYTPILGDFRGFALTMVNVKLYKYAT